SRRRSPAAAPSTPLRPQRPRARASLPSCAPAGPSTRPCGGPHEARARGPGPSAACGHAAGAARPRRGGAPLRLDARLRRPGGAAARPGAARPRADDRRAGARRRAAARRPPGAAARRRAARAARPRRRPLLCSHAGRLAGLPQVVHVYSSYANGRPYRKHGLGHARHVIAPSADSLRLAAHAVGGFAAGTHARVVYNGVDVFRIATEAAAPPPLALGGLCIGMVGHLDERKNPLLLVEAAGALRAELPALR